MSKHLYIVAGIPADLNLKIQNTEKIITETPDKIKDGLEILGVKNIDKNAYLVDNYLYYTYYRYKDIEYKVIYGSNSNTLYIPLNFLGGN